MTAAIVYAHPDGGQVALTDGYINMTGQDASGAERTVSLPIGSVGIRELGEMLVSLASIGEAQT